MKNLMATIATVASLSIVPAGSVAAYDDSGYDEESDNSYSESYDEEEYEEEYNNASNDEEEYSDSGYEEEENATVTYEALYYVRYTADIPYWTQVMWEKHNGAIQQAHAGGGQYGALWMDQGHQAPVQ